MIMNGCTDNSEKFFGLVPKPSQLKIKNVTIELKGAIGLRYDQNDTKLSGISKQLSDRLAAMVSKSQKKWIRFPYFHYQRYFQHRIMILKRIRCPFQIKEFR